MKVHLLLSLQPPYQSPTNNSKKRQQLTGGSEAVEMILQAIKPSSSYFKELMASSSIADIVLV